MGKISRGLEKQIDLSDNLYSIQEKSLFTGLPPYGTDQNKWTFSLPSSYGFYYEAKGGLLPIYFFLPLAPQNLSIETVFATNLVPTLYGTIEEHSSNRYFSINLTGTTGFAPQYTEQNVGFLYKNDQIPKPGREKWVPGETMETPAVTLSKSGYFAFHNFYRFLMQYKQDIMKTSGAFFPDYTFGTIDIPRLTVSPLVFFNYKDNNKYKVCMHSFVLSRTAENPMLYNYSIKMTGYSLENYDSGDIGSTIIDQACKITGPYGKALKGKVGEVRRVVNAWR